MGKGWIWVIIIVIVIIILIAFLFGAFYPLNKYLANQTPDISCKSDSDCKYFIAPENNMYCVNGNDCFSLDFNDTRVIGVNKNWNPFCIPKSLNLAETQCIGGVRLIENSTSMIKCIDDRCEKVL